MNGGVIFWRVTCYGNGGSCRDPLRPAGLDPCAFDRTVEQHQDMIAAIADHEKACPWTSLLATGTEIPRDP